MNVRNARLNCYIMFTTSAKADGKIAGDLTLTGIKLK